jgi:hypothetical protein
MSMPPLVWAPTGPVNSAVWKAILPSGWYEIEHATLTTRFIRTHPYRSVTHILPGTPFSSLEEAQEFCETYPLMPAGEQRLRDESSAYRILATPPAER